METQMKEKTKLSKILALVMCLMLTLTMFSTYSFATILQTGGEETTDNKANIIVNGVEAGVKVSAYQLTTVNYDYTADQPESTPYEWVPEIETLVRAINSNYVGTNGIDNFVKEITTGDSAENSKSFYSELASAIRGGNIEATKEATVTGSPTFPITTNGSTTLEGLEMGTYLVLIENGYKVYTPSVVNLTPEFKTNTWVLEDKELEIKSSDPSITKTVTNDTLDKDNYGTKDTISFKIVADVPKYISTSTSKDLYISDDLSNGLTLTANSIKVYGQQGSAPRVELTATEDYTLTTENAKRPDTAQTPVDFVLNFVYDNISSYNKIIVEYSAKLAQDDTTVIGSTGNTNTAYLDYSNNPYGDELQTQTDTSTVYTYGMEITKTDIEGSAIPNGGAEFTLSLNDEVLYFVKTADGTYYLANEGDADGEATTNLIVDNNSKLRIYGLDTGTYSLTETKAPDGYYKSTTPKEITITDEADGVDGILDNGDGTGIYKANFQNSSEFQLPVTGGMGTVIFVAGGIVFIGLGILLLTVVVKKNRK